MHTADRSRPPFFSAFHALAVDDARGGTGFPLRVLAALDVQRVMNAIQRAVPAPQAEVIIHRASRRQVLGNVTPLASRAQHVHKPVHLRSHVDTPLPAATLGGKDQRFNVTPFGIGQVARVERPTVLLIATRATRTARASTAASSSGNSRRGMASLRHASRSRDSPHDANTRRGADGPYDRRRAPAAVL